MTGTIVELSLLTARRLKVLRAILDDPDDVNHDHLTAIADMLIDCDNHEEGT